MVVRVEGGYKKITIQTLEKIPPAKRGAANATQCWSAGPQIVVRCDLVAASRPGELKQRE